MLELFRFGKKTISNSLNIYIKTSGGKTVSVDLDPTWDIRNVKEIIAPKLGLEPSEVKIIFAGKELGDDITIAVCVESQIYPKSFHYNFINRNVIWDSKVFCMLLR